MKQFNNMNTNCLGFERRNEDGSKKVGLLIINLQDRKFSFLNDNIYFDRIKFDKYCLLTFHQNFPHQRKKEIITSIF